MTSLDARLDTYLARLDTGPSGGPDAAAPPAAQIVRDARRIIADAVRTAAAQGLTQLRRRLGGIVWALVGGRVEREVSALLEHIVAAIDPGTKNP